MNFQSLLDNIKLQINKVATFLISRDVVTFLLFLFFAFFLWYMYSIGTKREINHKIAINYTGIDDNVLLDKKLPKTLKFTIKDEGKNIWEYNKSILDTIEIDLTEPFKANNNTIEVKYEEYLKKLLPQLSPSAEMIKLSPNYFSSSYIHLHTKSVPVMTSNNIKLAPQHIMYDTITISPKFVTIIGTAEAIDTISYLYLEPINDVLNKTYKQMVKIQKPKNVELNKTSVQVTIPIEMCTEKEIIVPITIENAPENISIRTFPSNTKIKFNVGLSRYNSVTSESFKAILDYNDISNNINATSATLQLDYTSGYIFNIQLNPANIEFLIENTK